MLVSVACELSRPAALTLISPSSSPYIPHPGLVGYFLETRDIASFSLLANGLALPSSCTNHGAYFLMVVFLLLAFVAPLLQLWLYGIVWLAPLTHRCV